MFELLGLLSRIKIKGAENALRKAADQQSLFPLVGAIIGIMVAIVGAILFDYLGYLIGPLLVAVLLCIFLYFVTGIIHLEGLADYGDGLMASGDSNRKRAAMKDVSLGAGGTFLMILGVLLLIFLFSQLDGYEPISVTWFWGDTIPLILGVIIAEIAAKLAMITSMRVGPSSHEGMGSIFVSSSTNISFISGTLIAIVIGVAIAGIYGLIVLMGLISGLCVSLIARKHFGGVAGDSFGASNEVGRLVTLFIWVIVL